LPVLAWTQWDVCICVRFHRTASVSQRSKHYRRILSRSRYPKIWGKKELAVLFYFLLFPVLH
jgi:hypothetical protein